MHGGEESGTDASLRVLYELADRSDCAAQRILDEAVVVILPTQNPDGREADTRRNAYGFDMNRDWFARTQPETDGKVEFLRRYPPVLFIDAHEMGNTGGYFFPPNADPIYHEIADPAVDWINDLYGPAMQDEVRRPQDPLLQLRHVRPLLPGVRRHRARHRLRRRGHDVREDELRPDPQAGVRAVPDPVDLALGRGEQGRDPARVAGRLGRRRRQGEAGELEPNEVVQPENEISQPGGPDRTVRQYFLRADEPARRARCSRWSAGCSGWTSRCGA